jgi:hypothetical protein
VCSNHTLEVSRKRIDKPHELIEKVDSNTFLFLILQIGENGGIMNNIYKYDVAYIYKLIDPRDNEIRYIGWTIDMENRYKNHLYPSFLKEKSYKNNWIKSLLAINLKPIMELVEEIPFECWEEREKFWIPYYRSIGCKLTNATDGGEGVVGKVYTTEERQRMSDAQKGKKLSEETKRKIGESSKGRKLSEESRKKISLANKGRQLTEEQRKKLSESLKNRKFSDIALANMAEGQRGRKHTEEEKRKISEGNKGRKDGAGKKKGKNNKYCGVRKTPVGRYAARIVFEGVEYHLGTYDYEEDAAKAYNEAALKFYGENTVLNVIEKIEEERLPIYRNKNVNKRGRKINKPSSSKYIGVSFDKRSNKWLAYINLFGKRKHIGYFVNEIDAAIAYNELAIEYYGEDAILNDVWSEN